jgi:hypothetical protein
MTDIEKARKLFHDSGLAFPTLPGELAVRVKEQGNERLPMRDTISDRHGSSWLFSTRELDMSPYNLQHYTDEAENGPVNDYVILSHSGHGINSYAIQYYLARGYLRMFLHLGWGGAYADAEKDAAKIRECFSLADRLVAVSEDPARFRPAEHLIIVSSDVCGSYWLRPGETRQRKRNDRVRPAQVITQALKWLTAERKLTGCLGDHSNPAGLRDTSKPDNRRSVGTTNEFEGQLFLFPEMHPMKKLIPAERK